MKSILILSLLFSFNLKAQTEVFSADFQKGITNDWQIIIRDNHTVNSKVSEYTNGWITTVDPKNPSDTVASSTSYFTTPGKAERWLISPQIQLGKFGNYLSWQAKSHDASFPDDYKVLVSTSPELGSFKDTVALILQEGAEWNSYEVNLKEFALEEKFVYFAFILTTNDGFKIYLDDIKVRKEDPVSVNELSKVNIAIYPNPANEMLEIKTEHKIILVTAKNINGQTIEVDLNDNNKLNTSKLENGIYLLNIQTERDSFIQKIVVKH